MEIDIFVKSSKEFEEQRIKQKNLIALNSKLIPDIMINPNKYSIISTKFGKVIKKEIR